MGVRKFEERGQNLIEFALLTPFVLVFMLTIVLVSLTLFTRSNLQQATRETARQIAVGKPLLASQQLGAASASDILVPTEVHVCLPAGSSGDVGDFVEVSIWNDGAPGYEVGAGIFERLQPFDININPKSTVRLEKSRSDILPCT